LNTAVYKGFSDVLAVSMHLCSKHVCMRERERERERERVFLYIFFVYVYLCLFLVSGIFTMGSKFVNYLDNS